MILVGVAPHKAHGARRPAPLDWGVTPMIAFLMFQFYMPLLYILQNLEQTEALAVKQSSPVMHW